MLRVTERFTGSSALGFISVNFVAPPFRVCITRFVIAQTLLSQKTCHSASCLKANTQLSRATVLARLGHAIGLLPSFQFTNTGGELIIY